MRMFLRLHPGAVCFALVVIAGCSGGGGEGGPAPVSGDRSLGSRPVPGGTIAVVRRADTGVATPFRITFTGGVQPGAVLVRLGAAYDAGAATTAASVVAGTPGVYEVELSVPATPPAGTRVWVRLSWADGTVVESGLDDFAL
jgi:hypothetical protein